MMATPMKKLAILTVMITGVALGRGSLDARVAEFAAPGDPATYLGDAPGPPAAGACGPWLAQKRGWTLLGEDDTTHRFQGCAVLLNDKIVAVLQKDAATLEIYSRQTNGVKLCARLQPVCDGRIDLKAMGLSVKENTRSGVSLEVAFRSPQNEAQQITYDLTAGVPFIKTTASAGVEKLRVHAPCRFVVLPDFFGDDMLVDAATIPVPQAELPGENFLLHLMHGGEAILMTVSESRENDAAVSLSAAAPREIVYSDISYGKKPHVWVAVLAEQGIWHQRTVALADAGKEINLDWKMPFAALWRVDWSTADKLTDSWEMLLQQSDGKYVMQGWFGQNESEGQSFGKEFGDRDWNKPGRRRWNPVLSSFLFPCWIDNDGRAYLQPLKDRRYQSRGTVYNFDGPVVIYPIDRAQNVAQATPLEKLTVVDLVRMTLGVGPCQYILDLEGQKRNSRGVATCYARDIINAIYKEGTQLQHRPQIEENLDAAVAFIRNVRERIDQYVAFGQELKVYLAEQKRTSPRHAEFLDELLLITERLDQLFEQNRERIHTPEYAQQNADSFRAELLRYTESDAYKQCAAKMAGFTSIGGAQDGLVASCRMIVKTLRQRAGIAMAVDPELKPIATQVRDRSQAILRNPTPYEAPRH
jgi:hypothetical protein